MYNAKYRDLRLRDGLSWPELPNCADKKFAIEKYRSHYKPEVKKPDYFRNRPELKAMNYINLEWSRRYIEEKYGSDYFDFIIHRYVLLST